MTATTPTTSLKDHFALLAQYNQWMNEQFIAAASPLSEAQLTEDRGAFFHSILGTMNHLVVGDTVWLQRFATHSPSYTALAPVLERVKPQSLRDIPFPDWRDYVVERRALDNAIIEFIDQTMEADYARALSYHNMAGDEQRKLFGPLLLHFFNHQTHHRGQTSTLLQQFGIDVGVTDLLVKIPLV